MRSHIVVTVLVTLTILVVLLDWRLRRRDQREREMRRREHHARLMREIQRHPPS